MLTTLQLAVVEAGAKRRGPLVADEQGTPRALRARIRRQLRARCPGLAHLAALVANAAEGPDPESGLVYLKMLREQCDAVMVAALRR